MRADYSEGMEDFAKSEVYLVNANFLGNRGDWSQHITSMPATRLLLSCSLFFSCPVTIPLIIDVSVVNVTRPALGLCTTRSGL